MTAPVKPKRILVAESDPTISDTLREFLIHIGYETDTANDRNDVLEKVSQQRYGVILLDYLLNFSGDRDLIDEIRLIDSTTGVLILLSFPLVEYVIAAFRKGAIDVAIKPVDLTELAETVEKVFRRFELNLTYQFVFDNLDRINQLIDRGEIVPLRPQAVSAT